MGSRLGRRVVNFANLPIKLFMPSSFTTSKKSPSNHPFCFQDRNQESFGVSVRFRGGESENPKHGVEEEEEERGLLIAKADYKKAYVTLKSPLSISTDLYPIRVLEEYKRT